jgi:hypothetical protein
MREVRAARNPVCLPIVAYCDECFCMRANFGMIAGSPTLRTIASKKGFDANHYVNDTIKEDADDDFQADRRSRERRVEMSRR